MIILTGSSLPRCKHFIVLPCCKNVLSVSNGDLRQCSLNRVVFICRLYLWIVTPSSVMRSGATLLSSGVPQRRIVLTNYHHRGRYKSQCGTSCQGIRSRGNHVTRDCPRLLGRFSPIRFFYVGLMLGRRLRRGPTLNQHGINDSVDSIDCSESEDMVGKL